MVKLRLVPTGKSIQPTYDLVASDSRTRLQGRVIEILGFYDPIKKVVRINEEAIIKWLMLGAQVTATVRNLLSKKSVMIKYHEMKSAAKKQQKLQKAPIKISKKVNSAVSS